MARKRRKATATAESEVKRDLRSPKYRMRVVEDKRHYNRKKHKRVDLENWPGAAGTVVLGEFFSITFTAALPTLGSQ